MNILKLNHGLNNRSSLEDNNTENFPKGRANFIDDADVDGIEGVENRHEDDIVGSDVIVHSHQLMFHLLGVHVG